MLARELGMTVGYLYDNMTDQEMAWWKQLYVREHDERIEQS